MREPNKYELKLFEYIEKNYATFDWRKKSAKDSFITEINKYTLEVYIGTCGLHYLKVTNTLTSSAKTFCEECDVINLYMNVADLVAMEEENAFWKSAYEIIVNNMAIN